MKNHTIAPYSVQAGCIISPQSYLIDRVVPDCEHILMPEKSVAGGVLSFGRAPLVDAAAPSGRRAWLQERLNGRPAPASLPHENVFDLRRNAPSNWAHFLNNHLPIVFTICDRLDIDPSDVLLVLPQATPNYIKAAATAFGLKIMTTDTPLEGQGIVYDALPWTGIRPERADWVRTPFVEAALSRMSAAQSAELPKRVFLSRRDTRAPLNEAEIMAWLTPLGFHLVYPEDLSAADQINLFQHAVTIVAVHGAGMAPLLYAQPGGNLRHLIEILHAGHMTDVFRVMAQQVGVNWIGVRGRVKPEYMKLAYDFSQPFKAYSLDNFEIDLSALQVAFETNKIT